jgi:hypothetical protein
MNHDPGQATVLETDHANTLTETKNLLFIENIKGLFLMNGGGAVALAAWLQTVWEKEWATGMLSWQLWGMAMFACGVLCAGLGYLFRFLAFYHRNTNFPFKNPYWWSHVGAVTFSMIFFAVGALLVVKGGFVALKDRVIVTPATPPPRSTVPIPVPAK